MIQKFASTLSIPEAQRAVDECRAEIDRRRHEILELGHRRRILAETVRSSEDDQVILSGNAELQQIHLLLNSKETVIQKHEMSLAYAEESLERSKRQVNFLQARAAQIKNDIARAENEIARLERDIEWQRGQIAGLNDELPQYADEERRIIGG